MITPSYPKTTRAAVLVKTGQPLQLIELELPELKQGQVLVKVIYSGICRSQLNEIYGIKGPDPYLPHTLGHEGSGIVINIGKGVCKVKPGDHVVLSWIKGLGADIPSSVYNSPKGPINSGAISTFLEYAVISENRITPIDPLMPLKEAALLGCAIPTGAGIILNNCRVKPGESVAVFGCGGVGISAIMAANLIHAYPIFAIDINNDKLKAAAIAGATHLINPSENDPFLRIMENTHNYGVDYSIEASGNKGMMESTISTVRVNGTCVIAGNVQAGEKICINPYDLINGKKILGTWGGETNPDNDIPRYVQLFLRHRFSYDEICDCERKLCDINNGIMMMKEGKSVRCIIHNESNMGETLQNI